LFGCILWAIVNREEGEKKELKEARKEENEGKEVLLTSCFVFYDFQLVNPLAEFYERLKKQNVNVSSQSVKTLNSDNFGITLDLDTSLDKDR
jgi:hypothetical protein